MRNIVFVKGNIIGTAGIHYATGWVALAPECWEKEAAQVIDGDLVLDEKYQIIPYCIYCATGGVSALGLNTISASYGPTSIIEQYHNNIQETKQLIQVVIPKQLRSNYYRLLYIGIIGCLESFITELLACLVLGNSVFFHSFVNKYNYKLSLNEVEKFSNNMLFSVFEIIYKINAHDLKKIKEVITQVFSIDFPSIAELGAMIKTRHDLVHRNGYKIKNNILIQEDITTSDLLSLIEACDIFVNELTKNLTSSIKKWESEMLDMARNEDNNHGY